MEHPISIRARNLFLVRMLVGRHPTDPTTPGPWLSPLTPETAGQAHERRDSAGAFGVRPSSAERRRQHAIYPANDRGFRLVDGPLARAGSPVPSTAFTTS